MGNLKAGFAKININPPLGMGIDGYYIPRFGKGFLDDLEASAIVVSLNDTKIAFLSIDNLGIYASDVEKYCGIIEEKTGIPKDNIYFSATHTHTAPLAAPTTFFEADDEPVYKYAAFLEEKLPQVVKMADEDLSFAKMGYMVGEAPKKVAYIRRYKMKDGSTMTCPPIDDPNIDHPIGELDNRVNVLRFKREDKNDIVIVNYGLHADTVNGELYSADWPGWMRRTLKVALDGVDAMFISGAQGDVGSTNVHPKDGDMNDTEISFDNEMKSPEMARFVGRAIAGTVMQVFYKVKYVDVDEIKMLKKVVPVKANIPTKEELVLAREYNRLHEEGKDHEIPYTAMELTTVVAEAIRMVQMENHPEYINLELAGAKIGPVAFLGIPGEPFTDIGVEIKDTEGFELIMPSALTNGNEGYFPMESAYSEGGYEARTSPYKSGVAEAIIKNAKELLGEL